MLTNQERMDFNGLRTNYYISARILFIHNQEWMGAMMYGYAIESLLKQTLLELGNKKKKLQYSHDLKLLFESCKAKGAFANVIVPDDFIDYSNSLFQMRYPSTEIHEAHKAYARDKVLGIEKSYLFCYDDYFQQLDESLFELIDDCYSSSILTIFARLGSDEKHYGLYFNVPALSNFEIYKQRIKRYFPQNVVAKTLLENNREFFWTDGDDHKIYADLKTYSENKELPKFVFPGKVHRNDKGQIVKFEF